MKKLAFVCVALFAVAASAPAQFQEQKRKNDLKQIGLAYHNFFDANRKGPAKVEDLEPYYEKDKKITELLKSEVTFIYGVDLTKATDGTSNTVLAYEKQTPEKGGLVLMLDGSVKKMTAEEFKKAPKGKGQ